MTAGKMGRPQKYSPEFIDKLFPLFSQGLAKVEVSQALGISKKTYDRWKKKYKAFRDEAEVAEDAAEAWHVKDGRENRHNKDYRVAWHCFVMKTQFKYRETDDKTNPNTETGQPLTITFEVAPPVSEIKVTNAAVSDG